MMNTRDFSHLCRLCLVKDNVNVPIFENNDEGGKSVYSMICSCLPVKLSEVDNLPKKICSSCIEKLNSFYEFRKISSDSEKQLIQWLQELELEPEKSEQDFDNSPEPKLENVDSTYVKNDNNSNTTGVLSTLLNQPEFQENFTLDHSQDSNGEPSIKKLKSNATSSESDDEDNVQTKLESDSNESDAAADQDQDADCGTDSGQLAADNNQPGPSGLGKSSDETPLIKIKQENMEVLMESIDEKIFFCPTCQKSFPCKKNLTRHKLIHTDFKPYACEVCQKSFREKHVLNKHTIRHKENRKELYSFQCEVCQKKYRSKQGLDIHKRRHFRQFSDVCNVCNKGFYEKYSLEKHMLAKHGTNPFICDICNKQLCDKASLQRHKAKHDPSYYENKHRCEICGNVYLQEMYLKRHIAQKHTLTQAAFICDLCGKKVFSKSSLEAHIRIHQGLKPFSCTYCEKSFAQKSTLRLHLNSHTGKRPHKCLYCNKAFTQRAPLVIHMRYHTGEKPYKCHICENCFVSRTALNVHIKKKH